MITGLISLLGSSAFGALFGSIFQFLNRREERAAAREKMQHDETMQQIANSQQIALADKGMQATQVAGEQIVLGKEADAFVESQRQAFAPTMSGIVEIARGVIRPLITVYLLVIMSLIAYQISVLVGGLNSLDGAKLFALYGVVIDEVFFLLNLCVSWWFGARGNARRGSLILVKSRDA